MDIFTLLLWVITLIWFLFSLKKDKQITIQSIKSSSQMIKTMGSEMIGILFLIGLILTFIPPELIETFMGESNLVFSTIASAFIGSITLIPAFVAFPLVGSLLASGASVFPVVAFLTTLTMVGVVTFPLERKEFGLKFTLLRNGFSFIFAILIALVMGGLLS